MSYCRNVSQQISMNDSMAGLTERERKRLENSWAKEFGDVIFPMINEDRFSVLYSDNPASRPNNPVNVNVGLLILKEVCGQSDEEAIDSLIFDIRYQYALHTTSFEEQPISKNSLSNFRRAVYEYCRKEGRDLIQEEVESHAEAIAKLLSIDGRTSRMDSMMISSYSRRLTRLELIDSCVSRMVSAVARHNEKLLPEKFKEYLREGHRSDVSYRIRREEVPDRMKQAAEDAEELFQLLHKTELSETDAYHLLERMLLEQTQEKGGQRVLIDSKEVSPESLQNPTDPDAEYRTKGGNQYVGYVGNIVEDFNGADSVITSYDLQKSTYSDQSFAKDLLDQTEMQEEESVLLVDGTYYADALAKEAAEKNIRVVTSGIVGREPKGDYSIFEINEEEHEVKKCAAGRAPLNCRFQKGIYKAYFAKKHCGNCPNLSNCPVSEQRRRYMLKVAETQVHTSKLRKEMGTKEYRQLAGKRAGIEGIPSALRRKYRIDRLPVRGLVRSKIWFGLKIEAINVIRYLDRKARQKRKALKFCFDLTFSSEFYSRRIVPTILS